MALQFILGGAGSGKSTFLYDMIAKEASEHRDKQYLILVPDQFTLETQKLLVEKSGGGILNIDVLSFHRLSFRAFERMPALQRTILEDMGKTMLLRKVFSEQKDRLTYFKKGIDKPGFLDECKSFLCELEQYGIRDEEDFDRLESLGAKFGDIRLIYDCFKEKMGDAYMMAEELTVQLTEVVHKMEELYGAVICLDGFTGFTPTQYDLIGRLMEFCGDLYVTVTVDTTGRRGHVFQISEETIRTLTRLANRVPVEVRPPVMTGRKEGSAPPKPYRFPGDGELAFLEQNLFTYPAGTWHEPTEDIRLYIGKKVQDEAAYVARRIWWMTAREGYEFQDIAVIAGDLSVYEPALTREFTRMGIRFFLDAKKNIGANWIAEYIQALLDMYLAGMDYESTFRFLRCGLSPLEREETDLLENYVLATGKRGFSSYKKEWDYQVGVLPLDQINASREKVVQCLAELFGELSGSRKTVEQYTRALYSFLVRQDVYGRLLARSKAFEEEGEEILAREYRSVYRVVIDLFDEMVELLGEETVSVEEYSRLLAAGISEGLVGFIPPKTDQVVVGDTVRTRLKDIRVLFFVGFSDDLVPGKLQPPGIVNTRERRKIEQLGISLAPAGNKKAANDLFYLYLIFTKPSEKLIFTYSESDVGGEGRQASYVLTKIRRMFPKLTVISGEEETGAERRLGTSRGVDFLLEGLTREDRRSGSGGGAWWELWKHYRLSGEPWVERALRQAVQGQREGRLSEKALEALYGDELYGSITRLEQFAKCPYAYFILYGLALREREEHTVNAPDFGNVVHYTLKEVSDRLRAEGLRWRDLDRERIDSLVETCVEKAVEGYRGVLFRQSRRIEYMVTRIKRMMGRTVWAISEQMRRSAFEQEYSEVKFSYNDNLPSMKIELNGRKKLIFSGAIDRIDTCRDGDDVYVKVVDYKSGGVKLSLNSVFYGLQMQLVLYMAAALDLERQNDPGQRVSPAGMFYYYVKDPVICIEGEGDYDDLEETFLKQYRCGGYANGRPEVLQKLDSVFGTAGELECGARSACIPVETTKAGAFSKNSRVLNGEQWEKLIHHTTKLAAELGEEIMGGRIEASPYRLGGETGCDYCELKGICGMERGEFASRCRELEEKTEEDIWEACEEEACE